VAAAVAFGVRKDLIFFMIILQELSIKVDENSNCKFKICVLRFHEKLKLLVQNLFFCVSPSHFLLESGAE